MAVNTPGQGAAAIDVSYPVVATVTLALEPSTADAAGEARAGAAPLPVAVIARRVVAYRFAAGDLAAAQRLTELARQLLPGEQITER
jgi:hypothetical protein